MKMNRQLKLLQEIILVGSIGLNYLAGILFCVFSDSLGSVAATLVPVMCLMVYEGVYSYFSKRIIAKHKSVLGNPITHRRDDGSYELNPSDIYDAIEKLGYYEWEGTINDAER